MHTSVRVRKGVNFNENQHIHQKQAESMPKISNTELEEAGAFDSESDAEYVSERHHTSEYQDVENRVIRYIMSRELKSQLIRREHITQLYSNRRVNYDGLMNNVKHTLEDVYGLTLVSVPLKEGDKKGRASQSKTRQPLMLTNCLRPQARLVLQELWDKDSTDTVPNNRNTGDSQYFLPKYNKTPSMGANADMVKTGMTLLIMALLVVAENHMSEYELVTSLRQFGISDNVNAKNSNINANLQELLNELVKKDYLDKDVHQHSNNVDTTDYKLGRRSLVEFTPLSVFACLKTVYGDHFDLDTEKKALATIEKAYGVLLDAPLALASVDADPAAQSHNENDRPDTHAIDP